MRGYFRINDCPAGLEPPTGVRKRRKATVKKRRNTAPGFKALDPILYILSCYLYIGGKFGKMNSVSTLWPFC